MLNKKEKSLGSGKKKFSASAIEKDEKKKKTRNTIIVLSAGVLVLALAVLGIVLALNGGPTGQMGTGASEYLETRDITGRDIKYVEMCVEDYGKLIILLDATTAPKTVEHFLNRVNDGFYNGLTFHKVLKDTFIQGGDGQYIHTVKGEFATNGWNNDISHKRGVISMYREENSDCDSATCQFFICTKDLSDILDRYETPKYDGNYAAFGYVVEGMSVIDRIAEDYEQYNGVIEDKAEQPVIKYIKQIGLWEKP